MEIADFQKETAWIYDDDYNNDDEICDDGGTGDNNEDVEVRILIFTGCLYSRELQSITGSSTERSNKSGILIDVYLCVCTTGDTFWCYATAHQWTSFRLRQMGFLIKLMSEKFHPVYGMRFRYIHLGHFHWI